MTAQQLRTKMWRMPRACFELGITTHAGYALAQRGEIRAILDGGKWYVDPRSVHAYKARRDGTLKRAANGKAEAAAPASVAV